MLSNERLYLETRPLCLFFKASIPGAIGMIASNIYFSLEMLLIGRLIGQTAFAAGNLALPLILINFALSDMIAVGSAVRIAISLGEDDKARADRVFTTAVISAILFAGLASLLLIVFGRPMLAAMGAEGELLDESLIYLRTYAAFCPLTCLVFVFDNYLRICGRIRFSMVMNIVMSFLCLGFEFIFLYVLDLGIAFAALGTSLGMSVTAIICAWPFLMGRLSLGFVRLRPSFSIFHDIMAQGLPSFLSNISGKVTSILMNSLLLRWGGDAAVSVYGVFMNIDTIAVSGMYGIFDSLQPAIGYNWGAQRKDRVRRIALYCTLAIAIMCLAFTLLLVIFPGETFSLFLEAGADVVDMAVHAVTIMALTYVTRWIGYAVQSFSSAIGFNREATLLSLCNALVFPLLMMAILQSLELEGIWYVTPSAAVLTAFVAALVWILRLRKAVRNRKMKV